MIRCEACGTPCAPPFGGWPILDISAVREGSYVWNLGPSMPSWELIVAWIRDNPPLGDIKTFWVLDPRNGWELLITAMPDQESKMKDRFGAPLRIDDRIVWLSAPGTQQAVLLGTLDSWVDCGAKIVFDDGAYTHVRFDSEFRLIRWAHGDMK